MLQSARENVVYGTQQRSQDCSRSGTSQEAWSTVSWAFRVLHFSVQAAYWPGPPVSCYSLLSHPLYQQIGRPREADSSPAYRLRRLRRGLSRHNMVNDNVTVYLDTSLRRFDTVFPACGSSNSAIEVTIPELEQYSGSAGWAGLISAGTGRTRQPTEEGASPAPSSWLLPGAVYLPARTAFRQNCTYRAGTVSPPIRRYRDPLPQAPRRRCHCQKTRSHSSCTRQ